MMAIIWANLYAQISKIPWQVYALIGGLILLGYYGHTQRERGGQEVKVAMEKAQTVESNRQQQVMKSALQAEAIRTEEANARAVALAAEHQKAIAEMRQLSKGRVCVPASITRRFQLPNYKHAPIPKARPYVRS